MLQKCGMTFIRSPKRPLQVCQDLSKKTEKNFFRSKGGPSPKFKIDLLQKSGKKIFKMLKPRKRSAKNFSKNLGRTSSNLVFNQLHILLFLHIYENICNFNVFNHIRSVSMSKTGKLHNCTSKHSTFIIIFQFRSNDRISSTISSRE